MSSDAPKPPVPSTELPEDGPRYHEERMSAALIRSAHRPWEDWTDYHCPDCRQRYLTDEAVSSHWSEQHADGRWLDAGEHDPVSWLGHGGIAHVVTNLNVKTVHRTLDCKQIQKKTPTREVEHPGELPLSADRWCAYCDPEVDRP